MHSDDLELGPVLRLDSDDRAPIAPIASAIRPPARRRPGVYVRDPLAPGTLGRDDLGPDDLGQDDPTPGLLAPDRLGADEDLGAGG
jgi:hypothetical protein